MKLTFIKPEKEFTMEELFQIQPTIVNNTKFTFDASKLIEEKLKTINAPEPVIDFTEEAFYKMMSLVDGIDKEIAWHGVVETINEEKREYLVTDILVYPQRVAATTVDAIEDKYGLWMNKIDDETFNKVRLQGHSHVNMGVFASSTDEKYYDNLTDHLTDFYIVIIANKRREFFLRLYDGKNNLIFNELKPTLEGKTLGYSEWASEAIKENIQTTLPSYASNYSYWGYQKGKDTKKETKKETKEVGKRSQELYYYDSFSQSIVEQYKQSARLVGRGFKSLNAIQYVNTFKSMWGINAFDIDGVQNNEAPSVIGILDERYMLDVLHHALNIGVGNKVVTKLINFEKNNGFETDSSIIIDLFNEDVRLIEPEDVFEMDQGTAFGIIEIFRLEKEEFNNESK